MIKANVLIYNKHLDDLGVKTEDEKARFTCLKSEVISWRETIMDDEAAISQKYCVLFLKCGESALIDKSFNEIEEIMEQYV